MKIAIMGTRGIPARYGGFETFAEELSVRLADRGHQVTVYCRSRYAGGAGKIYRGVRRVVLPAFPHKYLDTVSHSFLSVLHGAFCRYDAILMCNAINSLFTLVSRAFSEKVAINVDGIERQRRKWNSLGKLAYLVSERLAIACANSVVADAQVIADYYRRRYRVETIVIPYGAPLIAAPPGETLQRWGLKPREYLLFVSRLEPENHAHTVIASFNQLENRLPLVIVGDAPYSREYIAELHTRAAGPVRGLRSGKVIFTGGVYGAPFEELMSNALLYLQATEVGGTHPALLQAMGAGNIILANDTPEHREVLADTGIFYRRNDPRDLAVKIRDVLLSPQKFEPLRAAVRRRVAETYSWEMVTDRYEALFRELLGDGSRIR
jgi:glycosyltransferase involved in cell wall biosynthesis